MQRFIELLQRSIWLGPLIGVIVGLIIGLLFGWVIAPVGWTPSADDIAAMADAYDVNPTTATAYAKNQLASLSKEEQSQLFTQAITQRTSTNRPIEARHVQTLAQALGVTVLSTGLTPAAPPPVAGTPPTVSSGGTSIISTLIPLALLLLVIVLLLAAGLIFLTRILPQLRARSGTPAPAVTRRSAAPPPAATSTVGTAMAPLPVVPPPPRQTVARPAVSTAPTTTAGGLGRFVASYALGNDSYDTSFSLETARQEFLGECGMGISETMGEGKPDKVTAFDLWLFDKADVRTVTQIIMSEYAFNDQALRGKLAAKGEAILAEKGKTVSLETQSLRITAQIMELAYATNPAFPPNSHFQKLTVEIVPSLKEAVAA